MSFGRDTYKVVVYKVNSKDTRETNVVHFSARVHATRPIMELAFGALLVYLAKLNRKFSLSEKKNPYDQWTNTNEG